MAAFVGILVPPAKQLSVTTKKPWQPDTQTPVNRRRRTNKMKLKN